MGSYEFIIIARFEDWGLSVYTDFISIPFPLRLAILRSFIYEIGSGFLIASI